MVDDIVKLLLAGSFSFAIIGISYAVIRFVLKVTDIAQDLRRPVQNVGELSDLALEDYKSIRGIIATIAGLVSKVNETIKNPLELFNKFSKFTKRKTESSL